eukprot:CAMPEP_0183339062 /NCGR_PEP_ID=MMETSP0164_2-20130417/6129_1 /TAXON_ID=221442 /ORGANISM="Coccolithus pelagicus ssp braarudi, Strain PLY182g" /LENGTH=33 /DNA_ID= /DNA_START= /DNA_END= /DNA_ORIENTATION=
MPLRVWMTAPRTAAAAAAVAALSLSLLPKVEAA